MQNLDAIEEATDTLAGQGIRVLNAFLLADDERTHAKRLLELMRAPEGAVVVDAGCGTGALALHMGEERPDLKFVLVNVSEGQLEQCPVVIAGTPTERILASFDKMPLADASADVVLFAFSLCHAGDWNAALREAARVLKPGGSLFVFDMVRGAGGDNVLMQALLQAHAYPAQAITGAIERAGFVFDQADVLGHVPSIYRLREVFASKPVYDKVFEGVVPFTIRAERAAVEDPIESAFRRHRNIAFQFSGGRDSTAALFKLRDRWEQMTVYHVDTGDQFPETREVVEAIDKLLPRPMVRIVTDVKGSRVQHGFPSDLVPVDNTQVGQLVSGRKVKIVSRYDCCAHNLMVPLHRRMLEDGMTLIVRGQRDEEYAKPPMRSGQVSPEGFEVLYPIQDWDNAQVDAYIKAEGAPVAPFYARGMKRAPECMGCTAWWNEGRFTYLREHHPEAYERIAFRVNAVHAEIRRQQAQLEI